jgi:hypothetical protein
VNAWKLRRKAAKDHQVVGAELERREAEIVDMAVRLVRLEAEVDIFRPFFVNPQKGQHA